MEELKELLLVPRVWISVAIVVAALVITTLLDRTTSKYLKSAKLTGKRGTTAQVGVHILRYAVYIAALFIVLEINGVNIGTLASSLGLATVAVAFAVQDFLKDIIMGTNIISGKFYTLGDVVEYQGVTGVVRSFNMRVTKLYDVDTGNIYAVSNRNISEIKLLSDWQDVIIPASYGEDVVVMREVCLEICERVEGLSMVKTCEFLGTDAFRDSCVEYRIRLHCNPARRNAARRAALGVIQDVLRERGIAIPFPQMDVHLDPPQAG